jgi:hypothetical protein
MRVVMKYPVDGPPEEVDEDMNLAQLQAYVGGYIEMLPTTVVRRRLIVNEDGIFMDLAPNHQATAVAAPQLLMKDGVVRGNALLVRHDDFC